MTSKLETLRQEAEETIEPVKETLETLTRYHFNDDPDSPSYSSSYFKDYIEYTNDIIMAANNAMDAYEAYEKHRPLHKKEGNP